MQALMRGNVILLSKSMGHALPQIQDNGKFKISRTQDNETVHVLYMYSTVHVLYMYCTVLYMYCTYTVLPKGNWAVESL